MSCVGEVARPGLPSLQLVAPMERRYPRLQDVQQLPLKRPAPPPRIKRAAPKARSEPAATPTPSAPHPSQCQDTLVATLPLRLHIAFLAPPPPLPLLRVGVAPVVVDSVAHVTRAGVAVGRLQRRPRAEDAETAREDVGAAVKAEETEEAEQIKQDAEVAHAKDDAQAEEAASQASSSSPPPPPRRSARLRTASGDGLTIAGVVRGADIEDSQARIGGRREHRELRRTRQHNPDGPKKEPEETGHEECTEESHDGGRMDDSASESEASQPKPARMIAGALSGVAPGATSRIRRLLQHPRGVGRSGVRPRVEAVKPRVEGASVGPEVRSRVVALLQRALEGGLAESGGVFALKDVEDDAAEPVSGSAGGARAALASTVEKHLYEHCCAAAASADDAGSRDYKTRARMLSFNLRKNNHLRTQLLSGEVAANEVVSRHAWDLAQEQIREDRRRELERFYREEVVDVQEPPRAVTSAPPAESSQPSGNVAATDEATVEEVARLQPGTEVELVNLAALEFNGRRGTLVQFEVELGRWHVMLYPDDSGTIEEVRRLKPANLCAGPQAEA